MESGEARQHPWIDARIANLRGLELQSGNDSVLGQVQVLIGETFYSSQGLKDRGDSSGIQAVIHLTEILFFIIIR